MWVNDYGQGEINTDDFYTRKNAETYCKDLKEDFKEHDYFLYKNVNPPSIYVDPPAIYWVRKGAGDGVDPIYHNCIFYGPFTKEQRENDGVEIREDLIWPEDMIETIKNEITIKEIIE